MWKSNRVVAFLGIPYRTLDHWVRSGLLSCDSPNGGTGNPRSWSAADVTRAAVVNKLRGYGYSVQTIRKSRVLDRLTNDDLASGVIVCTVGDVIGVVPTFDQSLKWKEYIDPGDDPLPITVAKFWLSHLSRDLPLDRQGGIIIRVTDVYESVAKQMTKESEVCNEQS